MTNEYKIGDTRLGTGVTFQDLDEDGKIEFSEGETAHSNDWLWYQSNRVDYNSENFQDLKDFVAENFGVEIPENFDAELLQDLVVKLDQAKTAAVNADLHFRSHVPESKQKDKFHINADEALDLLESAEHLAIRLGGTITEDWARSCFVRTSDEDRFAMIMTGFRGEARSFQEEDIDLKDFQTVQETMNGNPPMIVAGPVGAAGTVRAGVLATQALRGGSGLAATRAAVSLPGAAPKVAMATTESSGVVVPVLTAVGLGGLVEWGAGFFADKEPTYTTYGPASAYLYQAKSNPEPQNLDEFVDKYGNNPLQWGPDAWNSINEIVRRNGQSFEDIVGRMAPEHQNYFEDWFFGVGDFARTISPSDGGDGGYGLPFSPKRQPSYPQPPVEKPVREDDPTQHEAPRPRGGWSPQGDQPARRQAEGSRDGEQGQGERKGDEKMPFEQREGPDNTLVPIRDSEDSGRGGGFIDRGPSDRGGGSNVDF